MGIRENAALANAERVADEAIELMSRMADMVIHLSEKGAMNHTLRAMADSAVGAAKRLREELEG